ncbi:MAG TPA: ribonuclease P protein component [Patescibacteria group bacterium]|nr:ribonuclease P protein component [Patescibacteria group bacterium]
MSVAGFPRTARILSKPEFDLAFRAGLSAGSKLFRGLVVADAAPRLGITVPKRAVPLASSRNRIKRIVREAFRLRRIGLPAFGFVVVARGDIAQADAKAIRSDVEKLFDRLAALKPAPATGTIADLSRAATDAP